jgi:NAD-specific glutamate dehydrogenase
VPADSYERQALMRIGDTLDGALRRLAIEVAAVGGKGVPMQTKVDQWAMLRQVDLSRASKVLNEMLAGQPSLAKLSVAAGSLSDLPRG